MANLNKFKEWGLFDDYFMIKYIQAFILKQNNQNVQAL